jgi:TP901 family phage tail tape measure protein
MGNTIQDLIVTLGGDTTGIEGALGSAEKLLKEFGLSFAGIIEGFSFSAVIAATIEAGETFEKASIQMQRATGATGEALDGMEENFKNLYATSAASGEAIAGALSQISQKTGATGDELEALTKSELQFAKVTGTDVKTSVDATQKLFAQWGVTTAHQSVALDVLYVAMQQSGISAEQLNSSMITLGPVLRNLGFRFEESVAMVAAFGKAGLDATDMTMGLAKAFKVFSAAGEDPKQALLALIEKMGDAKTRADALNEAIGTFGPKAAGKLVDAVQSGAFNLADLMKALDASTGAVKNMSVETNTLGGSWTLLKRSVEELLGPLGKGMLDFFTVLVDGARATVTAFKELGSAILHFKIPDADPKDQQRLLAAAGYGGNRPSISHLMGPMPSLTPEIDAMMAANQPATPKPSEIGTGGAVGTGGGGAPIVTEEGLRLVDQYGKVIKLVSDEEGLYYAQQSAIASRRAEVTRETAEFNLATGFSATQLQFLELKEAAAALGMDDYLNAVLPATSGTMDYSKEIAAATKTVDLFAKSATEARAAEFALSEAGQLEAAFKTLHLSLSEVSNDLENNMVKAFATVANADQSTTQQIEAGWGAASGAINKLAKSDLPGAVAAYNTYIDALKRTGAAQGDIYAAQEKLLNLEIQIKQNRGQSSAAEIVQLTNVEMHMKAQNTLSAGLGTIYKGLMQNFDQAFKTLGAGLVAGITGAKTWGQAWTDILKSIETSILTTLIDAVLQYAEAWIISLIPIHVASAAASVGQTTGNIATAATGAAASQAAIPIIGPALAATAAAAMTASLGATYLPMAAA